MKKSFKPKLLSSMLFISVLSTGTQLCMTHASPGSLFSEPPADYTEKEILLPKYHYCIHGCLLF